MTASADSRVRLVTTSFAGVAQLPDPIASPHAPGVAVAAIRPRRSADVQLSHLAHDLLTHLGHAGLRATEEIAGVAAALLPGYLRVHHIETVVIHGTERAGNTDLVTRLAELVAPAQLWLVAEQPYNPAVLLTASQAGEVTLELATLDDLRTALRSPDAIGCGHAPCQPSPTVAAPPPFPPVPADEALTFLASVNELLNPTDAAVVRTTMLAAAKRAARACVPLLPGGARHDRTRGPLPAHVITHQVRLEVEHAHDVNEAVARVRGVQLAMLDHGYWLCVDIDDFVATYLSTPPVQHGHPDQWRQLANFRQPLIGATAAMAAAGVSRSGLEDTPAARVALDGSVIRDQWRTLPVPPPARFFLAAQHAYLRTHGGHAATKFLSHLTDGILQPAYSSQVATALQAPAQQLAVQLYKRPRSWTHRDEKSWATRWHLEVYPVGEHARKVAK